MKARSIILAFAIVSAIVSPLACNVFVRVDRCSTDADCPTNFVCDQVYAFCAHQTVDANTPDTASDTNAIDVHIVVDAGEDAQDADATVDVDASKGPCDLNQPFGALTLVSGLENTQVTSARLISSMPDTANDEKGVILSIFNGCEAEQCTDLFLANRTSLTSPFVMGGALAGVNTTAAAEYWGTLSSDGHFLFLESARSLDKVNGSYVNDRGRIWSATRSSELAQFAEPYIQDIFKLADPTAYEGTPYLHPNRNTLYFASTGRGGAGGLDIFVAALNTLGSASSIRNVSSVNSVRDDLIPLISFDERALYFARDRVGVTGERDILVATRSSPVDAFGPPSVVGELTVAIQGIRQWPSWMSDDQCRLYFISNRPTATTDGGLGTFRLWVAEHPK